jgi:surfeit locus 1 family protein
MESLSVIPDFVFRRVLLKGRWDHAHSMLLEPRVREGVHGAHVVTPLIREDGSTVLVDRGFISKEISILSAYQREGGEVEVLGMLRTSQSRNSFTPDNHPDEGVWHWTDVDAMANYAGGERAGVQPVFVEQIFGEFKATFSDKPSSRAFWQRGTQVKLVLDSSKESLLAVRRPLT